MLNKYLKKHIPSSLKRLYTKSFNHSLILIDSISPKAAIITLYYIKTGKILNLSNPVLFNEKIQWLKFYNYPKNKLVIKCTDKYCISDYLKDKNIENINAKLLGCWNSFDEINFASLPNKFILKTNNASGTNFFCEDKDKLEMYSLKVKFDEWSKKDFGDSSLERHYSKITPKIIAEEYLEFSNENIEYNFYCFNGFVRFCKVVSFDDKELKSGKGRCYDANWLELPFDYNKNKLANVARPEKYEYMLDVCEHIAKDFDFVRIDFFQCINKVVLGELTFSPASGFATAFNNFAQKEMGNWLKLNKVEAEI
jgi:hypothetical protein